MFSQFGRVKENHATNPLANLTSGAILSLHGMGAVPVGGSIEIRDFDFLTRPEMSS